ncbi:MAG: hypothetical protein ACN6PJ_30065, partial [Achromobacter sp.]|uniref:hypothetical protein n=1 Tax=Achromobacter sp. TaxID=134375 RepID=UPI003CFF3E62
ATRALRAAFWAQRQGVKGVRTCSHRSAKTAASEYPRGIRGFSGCEHLFALVFALWFALPCSRDQPKRNAHAGWQGFSP